MLVSGISYLMYKGCSASHLEFLLMNFVHQQLCILLGKLGQPEYFFVTPFPCPANLHVSVDLELLDLIGPWQAILVERLLATDGFIYIYISSDRAGSAIKVRLITPKK